MQWFSQRVGFGAPAPLIPDQVVADAGGSAEPRAGRLWRMRGLDRNHSATSLRGRPEYWLRWLNSPGLILHRSSTVATPSDRIRTGNSRAGSLPDSMRR